MSFSERAMQWARRGKVTYPWFFLSCGVFTWVWGWTPHLLRSFLPPMPNSLRNYFLAPFFAWIITRALKSFILEVLYRGISPFEQYVRYDQTSYGYLLQIVMSVLTSVITYQVIDFFSLWHLMFNVLFALAWGSALYILSDSYCIESPISDGATLRNKKPGVRVVESRGVPGAKVQVYSGIS